MFKSRLSCVRASCVHAGLLACFHVAEGVPQRLARQDLSAEAFSASHSVPSFFESKTVRRHTKSANASHEVVELAGEHEVSIGALGSLFTVRPGVGDDDRSSFELSPREIEALQDIDRDFNDSSNKSGNKSTSAAAAMGVKLDSAGDTEAFISAAIFGVAASLVVLVLFLALRHRHPAIYSHQLSSRSPAEASASDDLVKKAGLEATMHVEFYKLGLLIFAIVSLLPTLSPLMVYLHWGANDGQKLEVLTRLSLSVTEERDPVLWAHACAVWQVVLITLGLVFRAQASFQTRRFEWMKDMPLPQATTVLVQFLPTDCRSDKGLAQHFQGLFTADAIARAYVVRKTQRLSKLLAKLSRIGQQHPESHHTPDADESSSFQNDGQELPLPDGSVELEEAVRVEREKLAQVETVFDPQLSSTSGFVTFKSRRDMWASIQADYSSPLHMMVEPAPESSDVIYSSLVVPPAQFLGMKMMGWCWLFLLFLAWIPLVQFVASLGVLEVWESKIPALRDVHTKHPVLIGVVEGVLSTAGLQILMALLPTMLSSIIYSFFGPTSGAWAQCWLERIDFAFRFIFIVLVVALGDGIIECLKYIRQDPRSAYKLLADSLPLTSHYYLSYVLVGCSGCVQELLRIGPLLQYAVFQASSGDDAEERRSKSEEGSVVMGPRVSATVIIVVIGIVFCTICPVMAWLACVYCGIGYLVFKYLYSSAEPKQPELGGILWVHALDQLLFGLFVYVLMMMGVLESHSNGGWQVVCVLPAALLVAVAPFVLRWRYRWQSLPLDRQAEIDTEGAASSAASESLAKKAQYQNYAQEECLPLGDMQMENPQD